ncbi:MAG: glycosyltransferase, family [Acidobacteriaceae bacterium]|nr:glycosyltransferase, family [Acidobacteriaceae bacterium]
MKVGFLSMPVTGHLNPMTALARKLQSRGNEVVFIALPDAEPVVRAANLNFAPFCEREYPVGSIAKGYAALAKLHGLDVVEHSAREMHPGRCKSALEHLPEKLAETGVEALVIDTVHFFIELVPMRLGMPYVHIWNILHLDRSGSSPACFFGWPYETTPEALARNIEGLRKIGGFLAPVLAVAKSYAQKNGLQIDWNDPAATVSKLAVITQTPKEFDFPGSNCPPQFHYAGPFHDDGGRAQVPFPWEKLTGAPLIYASLGTLVNGMAHVYRTIVEAAGRFPETQLVLSVGKNIKLDNLRPIPSNAIMISKAPQIELLKRAALCITHAGLNTALEALAQGVPMVAIPIGFDQPGVAARIAYHGVGELVEIGHLTTERLSQLIQRVQNNPSYRDKARYFQKVIAQTQGLDLAAALIERAFKKNQLAD